MKVLKLENLTNRRFGKLKVTADYKREDGITYWKVRCICGTVAWMRQNSIHQGARSCGCENSTRFARRAA